MSTITISPEKKSTPVSEARRIASRLNGARSRGPKSEAGKAISRKNALKHGLTGNGVVLPETIAAQAEKIRAELTREYPTADAIDRVLIERAALAAARLDRAFDVEQTGRIEHMARALSDVGWDLDRAAEAEALGDKIARRPGRIAAELRTTHQGCDWLLGRWKGLAKALDRRATWDDDQRQLALDLLGIPRELRADHPCADPETPAEQLEELIRRETRALRLLIQHELADRDEFARDLAGRGLSYDMTPTAERLRKYEMASERTFFRSLDRLRNRDAQRPTPELIWDDEDDDQPENEPKPKPEPKNEPKPKPEPKNEPKPKPEPENEPKPLAKQPESPVPVSMPRPAYSPILNGQSPKPSGSRQERRAAAARARSRSRTAVLC
ncbi:hypothetical protein BH23PLA1_BH23PLA1_34150 [soil metagenome]